MTQRRNVSIPDEQSDYADDKGLSLSKVLQNELRRRMEQDPEYTVESQCNENLTNKTTHGLSKSTYKLNQNPEIIEALNKGP